MLMGTLLTLATVSVTPKVLGLSLTQVHVPPFGLGGQSVELGCEYDTQGEQVYSVKWYKGGLEIFRFVPSVKEQPMLSYPRPGVSIDEVCYKTVIVLWSPDRSDSSQSVSQTLIITSL